MAVDFVRALDKLKTTKLPGGIFGKTSLICVVLIICIAAVCLKVEVWWMPLALLLPTMLIVWYGIKRSFDFAEKNPFAAVMEGGELLVHEQIVHASKGVAVIPPSPHVVDHEQALPSQLDVDAPDPLPIAPPARRAARRLNNRGGQ